ncbi:MAG: ribosome biogenesis GTP-binding protein YihA/YsxC [Chthoniobacterales bacterium]|nr:ribosome biogenesis GTP-binding protein YihA/YsxC [Chthoniobacterales bacterium]
MKILTAAFKASSPDLASCPESALPEFALIGRSNVGKSSLINMLTRSQGLAKVSQVPGKTQLINFFTINNTWNLVDLPGYGYAKVGKKERGKFSAFVSDYLQHRPNLRGTFVLIDSRLSPQALDLEFLNWMVGCGLPLILAFTKTDTLSKGAVQKNIETFLVSMREITEEEPTYVLSSSKDQQGRKEILNLIGDALAEKSETSA